MGTDNIQFRSGELRCVGGDYGQLVLEGTTEEARRACDQIVAAARCRSGGVRVNSLVADIDDATFVLANRHAGLAGTPAGGVQLDLVAHGNKGPVALDAADRSGEGD